MVQPQGPSQLKVLSPSVKFGTVSIGAISSQTVTISNSGFTPLKVTTAKLTGSAFTTPGLVLPLAIAASQTASFSVRFTPKVVGAATGSISLVSDASLTPAVVSLSGEANINTVPPVLTLTPPSVSFSNVNANTSKTQAVTVTNTGRTSVTVGQASLTGAGFNLSGLPIPLTLAPNQSSTFNLVFTPTAAGNFTGALTLITQATPASTSLAMDGTGVAVPAIAVTINPNSATLTAGVHQQFAAIVTGASTQAVTWSLVGSGCTGAACGTISSTGLYTPPSTVTSPFTVSVRATSMADPTKSASASVDIMAAAIVSVSLTPTAASVSTSGTQSFAATVTGSSNTTVTWSLSGSGCSAAACGTISSAGLYTAPASAPSPATVSVKATSVADATKSASAAVTISATPVVSVSVNPSAVTVLTGATQSFSATVNSSSNTTVTWSLTGTGCTATACGTVSSGGLYTAPATPPSPATVSVKATSVADATKSASAAVTISAAPAPVSVSVNPTSASVTASATQSFSATVTGSSITTVTWSVSGAGCTAAACGTISSSGLYTAPATPPSPATVTVKATSAADASKSASANITIVAAVAVLLTLSPTSASVPTSGTQSFNATVTGPANVNTAVTWALTGSGCSGPSCGSISTTTSSAIYSAPAAAPSPANVSVTATSVADATKSAAAAIAINQIVAITLAPLNPSVATGATQQFTSTVTGNSNTAATWGVTGSGCSVATCGIINSNGLFTAPASAPTPSTVTVTATSSADATKSASTTVTISTPPTGAVAPILPTLPQKQVDVSMPNISAYAVVQVNAGGDLQAAINSASCNPTGTVIKIHAGAVFNGPYILPAKSCAAGQWIILRSDAPDSALPALGARITPAFEPQVPVILAHLVNNPSLLVSVGATNYRIMFLEGKVDSSAYSNTSDALIDIGDGGLGGPQSTVASQPNNIVIDRVLLRGSDTPPVGVRRGVSMQCQNCAVINSYIDQIHQAGNDAQAIAGWNSTGPWLIDNNYLSASGENVLVGGADINIPNVNPSDVTVTHNYFFKPLSWNPSDPTYAGTHWTVKNIFELKSGVRFLVQGNVLQNVWADAQAGEAVKINPSGSPTTPWVQVSDFTFQLNEVINAQGGFGGSTCNTGATQDLGNQRNLYQNNLLLQTGGDSGRRILIGGDSAASDPCGNPDLFFNHNTILVSGSSMYTINVEAFVPAGVVPLQRFAFHNNVMALDSSYGVHPNCALAGVAVPCWSSNAWWANIFFDTDSGSCDAASFGPHASACPVSNIGAVGFVNATGDSSGDYHLAASSIGKHAGTDGKDIGADIDALLAAIAGVTTP